MNELLKLRESPIAARVTPFIVFIVLTTLQDYLGEAGRYWVYLGKSIVGAWLLAIVWPLVAEMRWKFSLEAVLVGFAVLVVWIVLEPVTPKLANPGKPWNPHTLFGEGTALAWMFVAVRIIGSTLVVPPLEEAFYRSVVYRYLINPNNFLSVPLNRMNPFSLLITSFLFGLVHPNDWIAGIFCGMAYQWLVVRHGNLGHAMTAHAITNFFLGVWIVYKGAWQFW